jgi:hypothetical protein
MNKRERVLMRVLWMLGTAWMLMSCGTFEAETIEGAECKQECSMNMQNCTASENVCESAFDHCIDSCEDIDRLSK